MDLSPQGVSEYWRQKDQVLAAVIASMGESEAWVLQGQPAEKVLRLWELVLSDQDAVSRMALDQSSVVELLGWLSSGAAIRIVDYLDSRQFGAAAELAKVAEQNSNNPLFRVFIDRLVALSRTRLLSQVFSVDRMALVETAIRNAREGGGREN